MVGGTCSKALSGTWLKVGNVLWAAYEMHFRSMLKCLNPALFNLFLLCSFFMHSGLFPQIESHPRRCATTLFWADTSDHRRMRPTLVRYRNCGSTGMVGWSPLKPLKGRHSSSSVSAHFFGYWIDLEFWISHITLDQRCEHCFIIVYINMGRQGFLHRIYFGGDFEKGVSSSDICTPDLGSERAPPGPDVTQLDQQHVYRTVFVSTIKWQV